MAIIGVGEGGGGVGALEGRLSSHWLFIALAVLRRGHPVRSNSLKIGAAVY